MTRKSPRRDRKRINARREVRDKTPSEGQVVADADNRRAAGAAESRNTVPETTHAPVVVRDVADLERSIGPLQPDLERQAQGFATAVVAMSEISLVMARAGEIAREQLSARHLLPVHQEPREIYCRALTEKGSEQLSLEQYRGLCSRASEFDMFIDGMKKLGRRRLPDGRLEEQELSSSEFEILREYIESGKVLRPHQTRVGNRTSGSGAIKMFEKARRKVDTPTARYEFTAFQLHRALDKARRAYEFRPPQGFRFCLITPDS